MSILQVITSNTIATNIQVSASIALGKSQIRVAQSIWLSEFRKLSQGGVKGMRKDQDNLALELETKLKNRALNDTINALEQFFSDGQVLERFKLKDEEIFKTDLKVYAFELNNYIANDEGCHFTDKAMIYAFLSEGIIPLNSSVTGEPVPKFASYLGKNLEPLQTLINGIYQEMQYQWLLYLASRLNLWRICLEVKSVELSKKGMKNKPLPSPRTPRELMKILFSCRAPMAPHPIMTFYKRINHLETTPRFYHNFLMDMVSFYEKVKLFDPDN
ncbi:hypothetical protein BN7_2110 [Wickerhamomyces ciferrii]|uniref:Uncharacterized protein n=1 Tax=Wickerhamomyces ciferrii (strain ATCC 14091 / BCRC 22168 / CBS 111 / JCM 3599 / NBRC 0793 / NRRL Y-1031 F-60-10) TaxID=1206466 RepID=K0KHS5_WICCF|nr:uncharacterized protein BN7_2110 [Wickerhamomyces ciferrii]CCH42566.1 hypothetical protein BN7_2110 [Wickerhamomyces ciferrii]